MKTVLKIKVLLVGIGLIFYCGTTLCKNIESTKTTKGGTIIKQGEDKGKIGYNTTSHKITNENGNIVETIHCEGSGVTVCPGQLYASIGPNYDDIIITVQKNIDIGITAGTFVIEDFECVWEDGEKEIEIVDGKKIPVYGYKLTVAWKENETTDIPSIQVFPNPVQENMTVRFSIDMDAEIFVKIVDLEGNIRWKSNMYVSGNELQINNLNTTAFTIGTYFIICRNSDYTFSTSFLKE